jgi:hypothetical protein
MFVIASFPQISSMRLLLAPGEAVNANIRGDEPSRLYASATSL